MKTFDYIGSRQKTFTVIVGDTIGLWRQLELISSPPTFVVQNRASIAYLVVQTIDHRGHLQPRDKIVLVGRGSAKLIFPSDCDLSFRYWSDLDLSTWYRGDEKNWHRVKAVTRRR